MTLGRRDFVAGALATPVAGGCGAATWSTLPPTPRLPPARRMGRLAAGGASLWFAEFGPASGEPVVFLHGGGANSDYWGAVLPAVTARHRAIVLDARGQGRSTMGGPGALGYARFAADVEALLDHLGLARAAVVGWSDGGITGLALAMRSPGRVRRLFAFGANYDAAGLIPHGGESPVFRQFVARGRAEYAALSPEPGGYDALMAALGRMWRREPRFRTEELGRIEAPCTVADGAHDEIIAAGHTAALAGATGGRLVMLPCVSHFAMLQDPAGFAGAVLAALEEAPG